MKTEIVKIITPKNVLLDSIWLGDMTLSTVFIFIHGLGSSAFSNLELIKNLITNHSSVLTFNNRGHGIISRITRLDKRRKRGKSSFLGGQAHEIFTECFDDILGVVEFVVERGAKNIFLVGHSTGAQKAVYFLSKNNNPNIKGVILLSPLSDYAGFVKRNSNTVRENLLKIAESLVLQNLPHQLLPQTIWPPLHDAQRFLSLYSGSSKEEIFPYWNEIQTPVTFRKVQLPMLVVFGEQDEYRDRPIKQILQWFEKRNRSKKYSHNSIQNTGHGFEEKEKEAAKIILNWIQNIRG